ncbi:MAG: 50S ribosomal protein L10, partial [Nanoarchaeota archaeon]
MTPKITARIPEHKKNIVDEMCDLMRKSSITALVNMSDMPAPQLQAIRREMKGKISIYMTKKRLMKIALDKSKDKKKNIEALANYFEGMPAFIFSNENPFRLSRLLQKSRTKAPAKAGQIAPGDIVISKGPTPFAPGPIISELSSIGLKVGVEGGKIAIKENTVIARKGEKIKPKVAEILARLDIRPMDVGLGMVAAYEDGIIYGRDVLETDEKAFSDKLNNAAAQAFNLAFNIAYATKGNISLLIAKAFNDAKALGLS